MVVCPEKSTFLGGLMKFEIDNDVDVSFSGRHSRGTTPVEYRHPNIIDLRDFCLPTDNQGNTPHCVGYTVGGFLEVHNWKNTHIPRQINAEKLYDLGRKYKADTRTGTRLEYVLSQLKTDGFIKGTPKKIETKDIKYFIHQYGVVMCAFYITNEWYSLDRKYRIKEKKTPKTLGGHCVLGCGYCEDGLYIQNSWGYKKWGNYGFAIVPWNLVYKQLSYSMCVDGIELSNITEFFNA